MKRQLTMPVSMAWLATVVGAWLVTVPLLALLIKVHLHRTSATGLAGMAVFSATFTCVIVGGSASAVALRVRRNHGQVTTAELVLALRLRRYCREEQPPGQTTPDQTPPDQPEAAA